MNQPEHPGSAREDEVQPPMNRMVIAVLSLVGIFLAFYLVAHNLGWIPPIPCGFGNCEAVQGSKWAYVGPIPVSAIGLLGYVALFVLALLGLQPWGRTSTAIPLMMLLGSFGGVVFSAWLTYLEAVVIKAWCQYCVGSAVLITVIFLFCLPEIARLRASQGLRMNSHE